MAKVVLDIPDDVRAALGVPAGELEPEVRKELSVALYQRHVLSFGQARRFAGLEYREFEALLADRRVPRHYSVEDVEDDRRYAATGL